MFRRLIRWLVSDLPQPKDVLTVSEMGRMGNVARLQPYRLKREAMNARLAAENEASAKRKAVDEARPAQTAVAEPGIRP